VGRIAAMSESTRRLDDLAERLGRVKTLLAQLTNRVSAPAEYWTTCAG
jgi:hypothetical protein